MRIAFLGNVCNNSYHVVKALRLAGVDAHLYIGENESTTCQPSSDDPELLHDGYPSWIHVGNWYSKQAYKKPWKADIVQELRQYDFSVVCGSGAIFSQFTKKPSFFFITGGDFTVYPFPIRFKGQFKSFKKFWSYLMKAFWLRLGINRMTAILGVHWAPYVSAAKKLGVFHKLVPVYLPIIFDLEMFNKEAVQDNPSSDNARKIKEDYKFIVFHPSRLMIKKNADLVDTGQWKQNDLLIRAFAKFLKDYQAYDSVLVMPNTPLSTDVPLAKALINQLGIEANIRWVSPNESRAFTRHELIPYYSIADVVADDFSIGWFGSVCCEGLASGKPVISYIDEHIMKQLYPWHPFLSANTEDGIVKHLVTLYNQPDSTQETVQRGLEWVQTYHSKEAASQTFLEQFQNLLRKYHPSGFSHDSRPKQVPAEVV